MDIRQETISHYKRVAWSLISGAAEVAVETVIKQKLSILLKDGFKFEH